MRTLIQDAAYGIRLLIKNPGFSAVSVIALMLGIGANSAIFSVVNAVVLRPMPYEDADRLVFLSERSEVLDEMSVSYPNFSDWREQNQVFEKVGVYRRQATTSPGSGNLNDLPRDRFQRIFSMRCESNRRWEGLLPKMKTAPAHLRL